jgi:hypothetical protein
MRMPIQSTPVSRGVSTTAMRDAVAPSGGIACDLCMAACDHLSGIPKTLCRLACSRTVC